MARLKSLCVGIAAGTILLCVSEHAIAQTPPPDPAPAGAPAAPPAAPAAAPAPEAKAEVPAFFRGTEIGGLVDAYYDWYSTKPDGDAPYRNFDTRHNQFRVNMAQLWLAKAPTASSRAGYKIKVSGGPATTMVQSLEPGASSILQNIEEGFASYLAPLGKGLQFDVGKFVTQHGAEVIEAKDNWNYSRSLLFALAIPYYHSGVRATYAPNDKISFMGDIVNGWNNVSENNGGKTFGAQVLLKPTASFSLVQNFMAGPEQADNTSDWRRLYDTTATYTINPKLSAMANYDYGTDTLAGAPVHWQGVAGYLKFQANSWFAVSPRFELYDDPGGFTTGTPQTLKEATATFELKPTDTFIWRIEYRSDFSDEAVFKTNTGDLKKTQSSIAFGVLYSFAFKG
jgi:Putative beta-barrel porin-2, OmpL-like. bbp2